MRNKRLEHRAGYDIRHDVLEAKIFAEIEPPRILVRHDLLGRAFGEDAAGMGDVGSVDQTQGLADVVVGDEHTDTALLQVLHEILDVADRDRVDAGEGMASMEA